MFADNNNVEMPLKFDEESRLSEIVNPITEENRRATTDTLNSINGKENNINEKGANQVTQLLSVDQINSWLTLENLFENPISHRYALLEENPRVLHKEDPPPKEIRYVNELQRTSNDIDFNSSPMIAEKISYENNTNAARELQNQNDDVNVKKENKDEQNPLSQSENDANQQYQTNLRSSPVKYINADVHATEDPQQSSSLITTDTI
uniref:Uncharacterized protein n=1 Tax=Acrobeloides nanus TaxID=290746 RepID=A0A914EA21_9BILA